MKKYILSVIAMILPSLAFCQQMTWVGNEWAVQNQLTSLQNWGCQIYSVSCQNPYADIKDRRWVIIYDQR